jgi:hypothetical protein
VAVLKGDLDLKFGWTNSFIVKLALTAQLAVNN